MRYIPPSADSELQRALRELWSEIARIRGPLNQDIRGRRVTNASDAVDNGDYVTLRQLNKLLGNTRTSSAIIGSSGGGGAAGGGGGSQGCAARQPVVDAPDAAATQAILDAYTSANPGQIENSCLATGGNDAWLVGVVAALQADDSRWGFCGQRGDANDIAEDAVTYYCGDLSVMTAGSNNTFVYDIIVGHCGAAPTPGVNDVSRFACGAWVPEL